MLTDDPLFKIFSVFVTIRSLLFHRHIAIVMLSFVISNLHEKCSTYYAVPFYWWNMFIIELSLFLFYTCLMLDSFKSFYCRCNLNMSLGLILFCSTQLWWATPRAMCAQCVGEPWVRLAHLDGIFSSTLRTDSPTVLSVVPASQIPVTLTGAARIYCTACPTLF